MKFAQVRYGTFQKHDGEESKTYTYIVDDTVRTGDNITVSVIHAGEKKTLFATTGHLPPKENGGGTSKQMPRIETEDGRVLSKDDFQEGFTAKQLGVKKQFGKSSIYKGIDTEKPNEASLELRGKAIEVAYKSLIDQGKNPPVSEGEKTAMAIDYVSQKEQGRKYEPYASYMKREAESRNE